MEKRVEDFKEVIMHGWRSLEVVGCCVRARPAECAPNDSGDTIRRCSTCKLLEPVCCPAKKTNSNDPNVPNVANRTNGNDPECSVIKVRVESVPAKQVYTGRMHGV